LADHACALLGPHVDDAVVAGRDGLIRDLPGPDLGPLGGIAGALHHAAGLGYTSVLTIACDVPALPDGLLAALARSAPAFCPDAPVLGHWETASAAALIAHIESSSRRSVRGWAAAIGALPIPAHGAIPNINTPEDMAAL